MKFLVSLGGVGGELVVSELFASVFFFQETERKYRNDPGVRGENNAPAGTLLATMALGITITMVHYWRR